MRVNIVVIFANNMIQTKISIVVAGHTNVGKTTLIRTLMRSPVGVVGDQPNVTKQQGVYYYEGLQAKFIDSPGFQHGLALQMYLTFQRQNLSAQNDQNMRRWESQLDYDLRAVETIKESQVVLYVGSLENVPDDSFQEEIETVKLIQPKIIAILNKKKQLIAAQGEEEINNRIAQWVQVFKDKGIDNRIVFDAHWDNPSKVSKIYDAIFEILDENYKQVFSEGLENFSTRQKLIREEACKNLASCIEECKSEGIIKIRAILATQTLEEAKESIAQTITNRILNFAFVTSKLYEVATENPTMSKDDVLVETHKQASYKDRLELGSSLAGVLGGIGSLLGGIVGAIIGAVLIVGPGGAVAGAFTGAASGAQLVGVIGAGLGAFGIFFDQDDFITIKVTPAQLQTILVTGIAIIWGLSNNGFGRGREVSTQEIKDIQAQIINCKSQYSLDLSRVNLLEIIKYCENILDTLEKT